jgi:hypothetical protein
MAPVTSNNPTPIQGQAQNFTWGTNLAALITSLAAAVVGVRALPGLNAAEQPTVVAIYATIAVGILAAALTASADVLARAWVSAAKEQSSANPTGTNPTGANSTETSVVVRVPSLNRNPIPVITAEWDVRTKKTWYLVKEPGVSPQWVEEDKVEG